ncbi:MAG: glycosyltransferase family 2 protein [Bacteroidaceae bacterium]|nr:glycosyltransferase family 2 protein [Bacteroidaceae bacterium]
MALLSVIIPVYNSFQTLERCVNSILSQKPDDTEIILVDDGSDRDCAELCDKIAANDNCIKVIHRPNGGLSAARNTGIEASAGKWLYFIDSDDELAPHTLDVNFEWLESNPEPDMLEFPVAVHYGSPDSYLQSFKPETVTGEQVFRHWILSGGYNHCYAWNKIYRRELFGRIRFPEGETFEDAAICPDIIRQCRSIRYSDKGCYHYFRSEGSITSNYSFKNVEPLFRNSFRILCIIQEQNLDESCRIQLWNICLNRLTDLNRCKDPDSRYLSVHAHELNSSKPGPASILRSAIPFRQKIKALTAWLFGVRAACAALGIKKYS